MNDLMIVPNILNSIITSYDNQPTRVLNTAWHYSSNLSCNICNLYTLQDDLEFQASQSIINIFVLMARLSNIMIITILLYNYILYSSQDNNQIWQ